MRYLCIVLFLALAVTAHADIYKWVDGRGTVNYTEDLGKVPAKYRKKVTVIVDGGPTPAEVTETVVEPGGQEKKLEAGQKDVDKTPAPKQEKTKTVYGGKDEDSWRAEFKALRREIKANEAELAARRTRMANPGTISRGEYLGVQREAKMLEDTLIGLNGKLNALEESAQRVGVPLDVRK